MFICLQQRDRGASPSSICLASRLPRKRHAVWSALFAGCCWFLVFIMLAPGCGQKQSIRCGTTSLRIAYQDIPLPYPSPDTRTSIGGKNGQAYPYGLSLTGLALVYATPRWMHVVGQPDPWPRSVEMKNLIIDVRADRLFVFDLYDNPSAWDPVGTVLVADTNTPPFAYSFTRNPSSGESRCQRVPLDDLAGCLACTGATDAVIICDRDALFIKTKADKVPRRYRRPPPNLRFDIGELTRTNSFDFLVRSRMTDTGLKP